MEIYKWNKELSEDIIFIDPRICQWQPFTDSVLSWLQLISSNLYIKKHDCVFRTVFSAC